MTFKADFSLIRSANLSQRVFNMIPADIIIMCCRARMREGCEARECLSAGGKSLKKAEAEGAVGRFKQDSTRSESCLLGLGEAMLS